MDITQAACLAFVQGFTEFLPISSSGHLVLMPKLFGWSDQGLAFDVAVHIGSLIAVVIYFRKDVISIVADTLGQLFGRQATAQSRLGWSVLFATIPVGLAGLLLNDWIELNLRSAITVAVASILFGLVLWRVDNQADGDRIVAQINWRDILLIGCAQAVALIPGVSRSGMTILAGRLAGFGRPDAARFSFLMSIPVIILAGGLKFIELWQSTLAIDWPMLAFALVLSGVIAFACIHWFLGFIKRYSMAPFAFYLIALGGLILLLF